MAAEQPKSKNEWTAGIVAILAALLIGGAAPVMLYYLLFLPQTKRKVAQEEKLKEIDGSLKIESERTATIKKLEAEGEEVAGALNKIEARFSDPNVQAAVDRILELLNVNKLEKTPEAKLRRDASAVRVTDTKVDFPNGLRAVQVTVNCYGYWKDDKNPDPKERGKGFLTFIAALENKENATFVIGDLRADGDKNAGEKHTYSVDIWIILKRDIAAIGR